MTIRAIDLFAGWGGLTTGATQAGVSVVYAANHWPLAVSVHSINHPEAEHVCQDLRQADWTKVPPYELLLAAPACQGHSESAQPARAYSPHVRKRHDALRATAWAVVDCAEVTEPKAIIVENVTQFRRWKLYPLWKQALEVLGYHVQAIELNASRMGIPQRRKRLFVVATRTPLELGFRFQPEVGFGRCIDWRADGWREVASAAVGARRRIDKGRANHGDTFLTQHVTGHPGVSLDEPIRTIVTKDQWALVDGDVYRPLTKREIARAMDFPDSYKWPEHLSRADVIKGLGNAVPPGMVRPVIRQVAEHLEAT